MFRGGWRTLLDRRGQLEEGQEQVQEWAPEEGHDEQPESGGEDGDNLRPVGGQVSVE